MRKIINLSLLSLLLIFVSSCVTSLETSIMGVYNWEDRSETYEENKVLEVTGDFKIRKNRITMEFNRQEYVLVAEEITDTTNNNGDEVTIYDGYLNGSQITRVVYYPNKDMIIVFEGYEPREDRFMDLAIFK